MASSKRCTSMYGHTIILQRVAKRSSTKLSFQRPTPTPPREMTKFHTDDYISFLRTVTPENTPEFAKQLPRCMQTPPPFACFPRPSAHLFILQLTLVRTAPSSTAFSSFARYRLEDLLVELLNSTMENQILL